jgi:hypothetical protein
MSDEPSETRSACPHPEAVAPACADPISAGGQAELQAILDTWDAPGADYGKCAPGMRPLRRAGHLEVGEGGIQIVPARDESHLAACERHVAHRAHLHAIHIAGEGRAVRH